MNIIDEHIENWLIDLSLDMDRSIKNTNKIHRSINFVYYYLEKSFPVIIKKCKNKEILYYIGLIDSRICHNNYIRSFIYKISQFSFFYFDNTNFTFLSILEDIYRKLNELQFLKATSTMNNLFMHDINLIILTDFVLKYIMDNQLEIYFENEFENKYGYKNSLEILRNIIFLSKNVSFIIHEKNSKNVIIYSEKIKFSLDNEMRFHGDGKASVILPDGRKEYFFHGIPIPEKYGKVNSNDWKAEWVFQEKNVTIKRVLIDGIGWDRLLSNVDSELVDKWKEYELYRIK